jgi:hypothetical protein
MKRSQTKHLPDAVSLCDLRGAGKAMWQAAGGADAYVRSIREEQGMPAAPPVPPGGDGADRIDGAWLRVQQHAGETFYTATGLTVTHEVVGNGIWFYRDGHLINRQLTRSQFAQAVRRCPLRATTDINDLIDYPYLYALLTDPRIRQEAW